MVKNIEEDLREVLELVRKNELRCNPPFYKKIVVFVFSKDFLYLLVFCLMSFIIYKLWVMIVDLRELVGSLRDFVFEKIDYIFDKVSYLVKKLDEFSETVSKKIDQLIDWIKWIINYIKNFDTSKLKFW